MVYENEKVWEEVRVRLLNAPYYMKQKSEHLREGICPNCGKKTLWTKHAEQPGRVWCDRQNKCGYTASASELFPEIFDAKRVVRDYPSTPENPSATADAFMQRIRGFDLSKIKGWYQQYSYMYHPREAKDEGLPAESVTAVRFHLPAPMRGSWDRFMDGEHFGKKTYLLGGSKLNEWMWTPPNQTLEAGDKLFVTEGIFDAIALMHIGLKVAAILGSSNKPTEFVKAHAHLNLFYCVALDNDKAGQKSAKTLVEWFREKEQKVSCMQPSPDGKKQDWNDLWLTGKLNGSLEDFHYYGELLTAATPEEKALLMYNRTGKSFNVFEHRRNTYTWNLDISRYNKTLEGICKMESIATEDADDKMKNRALAQSGALSHLANCGIDFLYTQSNPVTDELFYFFRIRHADGRESLNTVTGSQLGTAADFRKRMLSMASGALISADTDAHSWLLTKWMNDIKDVKVVGYAGYSTQHTAWVFPSFAVHKGKVIRTNHEDYIELDKKTRVKSAYHGLMLDVNYDLRDHNNEWIYDLYTAWGSKGIVALAFWTLSLFAQQIRERNKSLPFLELVGDPGTGKSTLIEFLWKLFGRDPYEGFDPSSSNPAYVARTLNQVSNLPVVMIEGDRQERQRGHRGGFNWSETKKLYNGRGMKGRGVRTQGNETYDPPFHGTLVISQNAPVDAEQAVLERIVHCFFYKNDTNSETLAAVKKLVALESNQLSGYLIKCLTNADRLLKTYEEHQRNYEEQFRNQDGQKTYRLALNHSQLAAGLHMLQHVTNIDGDMLEECIQSITAMSLQREKAISREHPDVEQFFDVVEYLEQRGLTINHAVTNDSEMALNLNEVYEKAADYKQQLQQQVLLKPLLRNSRRFNCTKGFHSRKINKTVRCWFFNKGEAA